MRLTSRQLQILALLKNNEDWMTSEQIASLLNTNKKTIQNEIRNLLEEHQGKIVIQINRHSGYYLEWIQESLQQEIIAKMTKNKMDSSMNFRASMLATYLFFQEDYVSMQQLAELFFLSKATIALEIKTIQRWIGRNPKIDFEVSANHGLKIRTTENMRRIFVSAVGTEAIFERAKLPQEAINEFFHVLPLIQKVLRELLLRNNYIISGEDSLNYARYLALTLVRHSFSDNLIIEGHDQSPVPIIEELSQELSRKLSYRFSEVEKLAMSNRLLELNYLKGSNLDDHEIRESLRLFEKQLINLLHLPTVQLFQEPEPFINHLRQLKIRMAAGHNTLNHFAKKIVRRYPLETYLLRRYFPDYFGGRPNLAELSYLVLYLAEALAPFKKQRSLLLISNQPFSVLNALRNGLKKNLGEYITQFDVQPVYLFETLEKSTYDLLLTTEQELLFQQDEILYIPSVLDEGESATISQRLLHKLAKSEEKQMKQFSDAYFPASNRFEIKEKIEEMASIIGEYSEMIFFAIAPEVLLACRISKDCPTQIRHYDIQQEFFFQRRKVRQLFVVECQQEENVIDFFQGVAGLLAGN